MSDRPYGGGGERHAGRRRAAARGATRTAARRSRLWVHLPFAVVLVIAAAGFVRIFQYHWRQGPVLIAVALLLAAALRVVLSDERAGLIVIRSKVADVLCYAGFGALLAIIALTIKAGPLLP